MTKHRHVCTAKWMNMRDGMRWANDSKSSNKCWLVIGGATTLGGGGELTHSPFTFSLHSRGERKPLIHTHTKQSQSHTTQTQCSKGRVEEKETHIQYINTKEAIKYINVFMQLFQCLPVNLLYVNSLYTIIPFIKLSWWELKTLTWSEFAPSSSCLHMLIQEGGGLKFMASDFVCKNTYHDYISRGDTDFIMAASIKWI